MSKGDAEIAALFSRIASKYDLANRVISLGLDKGWRKRLIQSAAPKKNNIILDLCTGTADLASEFTRLDKNLSVFGVDLSQEMLKEGLKKTSERGLSNLLLVQADAIRLPFSSECFDVITIAFGLRNLVDTQAGLCEMARVLRPGGRLIILEFSVPQAFLWRSTYLFYLKHLLPRIGGWLTGAQEAYQYLHDSILAFPKPVEILAQMHRAGFPSVRIQSLLGGVAVLYQGERANFNSSIKD